MTRVSYFTCDHCGQKIEPYGDGPEWPLTLADPNGQHVAHVCLNCAHLWLPGSDLLKMTVEAVRRG